ncbi:YihY/virulence factor BrkB family protein [Lutibaculum baratangense]|uniref:Inner membrane protein YihY, formerly thought to be RNase BN n=1 Tax=Lutibaculum baratangense AMV1 TaxID=631454 RepID=V4TJW3_9HYPH|nr:YihY/virulence factor BrkB family protein [Lutibaculum baratangense]ESR26188.1 Inner membrane protein YihY, formerly thought to be RNase BN [Lutibaculum baratangense AMV1]
MSGIDPEIEARAMELRARERGRGREADSPVRVPGKGWKDIAWRTYEEIGRDRLSLVAAGVTFYTVLALFPAIGAFVSLYGLVADPATVEGQLASLSGFVPSALIDTVSAELQRVSSTESSSLSFAFIGGLLFALWSANKGVQSLFDSMNVVYEERESRGFFALTALTLAFTTGGIILMILIVNVMVVLPQVFSMLGLSGVGSVVLTVLPMALAVLLVGGAISLVYRYGPSRQRARWRWISVGSVFATLVWAIASALFTWYLANFANYSATYGSLGAVIGVMMWIWVSAYVVLIGAELNAEIEHQTGHDTTTGAPAPLGERGARMADTLGETS